MLGVGNEFENLGRLAGGDRILGGKSGAVVGEEPGEVDALFFPVGGECFLGGGSGAGGGEGFEDALGVEVDALLIGGNDEFGEGGAFGGVDKVVFAGRGFLNGDGVDGNVLFLEEVAEGGDAGEGRIGEGAFDGEFSAGGYGATKGDEFALGTAIYVALIPAAAGAGLHFVLEGDAGGLGIGGKQFCGAAGLARLEGDFVTVAVKVESAGAGAVVVADVAPKPLVGSGAVFEVRRVGDEGAFDFGDFGIRRGLCARR